MLTIQTSATVILTLFHLGASCQYLHELGINSIIEMHQDGFSRWLNSGCGSGFPKWTINPVLLTYPPTWFPNEVGKCPAPFDLTHGIDISSNAAWINFMDNWNGVRDSFLEMWSRLSGETHFYLIHCDARLVCTCAYAEDHLRMTTSNRAKLQTAIEVSSVVVHASPTFVLTEYNVRTERGVFQGSFHNSTAA